MFKRFLIIVAPIMATACATDRDASTPAESSAAAEVSSLSPSAAKGRAFAQTNCGGCHGMDDNVSPNSNAPSLKRAANRLPDWAVAGSFQRGVQVGHTTEMPVFVFEDDDVANLLAYFDTLKDTD